MNTHMRSTVKKTPTRGHTLTVFLPFYSRLHSLFFLNSTSALFHLNTPPLCLDPRCSFPRANTHKAILILLKGLHFIFFSVTLPKPNHWPGLGAGARRGDFTPKNPWKRHFPGLAPRGPTGYFRVQKHVFKLDMVFNYFVAV